MLLHDGPEQAAIRRLMQAPDRANNAAMQPTEPIVGAYRELCVWRHLRFLGMYKGFVEVLGPKIQPYDSLMWGSGKPGFNRETP